MMLVRSFTRVPCSSRRARSTGRLFGGRAGILHVFREPLERNPKLAELARDGSADEPLLILVRSEIEHPVVHESPNRLYFFFGRGELDELESVALGRGGNSSSVLHRPL